MVLRALEAAPIGTFHEFCARLLRTHAIEIGIDPEFRVFDAAIAGTLRDEAVQITLRRLLVARNEDLLALAGDLGLPQIRDAMSLLTASRTAGDLDAWTALSVDEIVALAIDLATARPLRHALRPFFRGEALPTAPERGPSDSPQAETTAARSARTAARSRIRSMFRQAALRDPGTRENQRPERERRLAVGRDQE